MKSQYFLINKKKYKFGKLVVGQYRQLVELDVEVPTETEDMKLISSLIKNVPVSRILAIALKPVEYSIMEKDIEQLEQEIEFNFTPNEIEEMVTDFFVVCPLEEIINDLVTTAKVSQQLARLK